MQAATTASQQPSQQPYAKAEIQGNNKKNSTQMKGEREPADVLTKTDSTKRFLNSDSYTTGIKHDSKISMFEF